MIKYYTEQEWQEIANDKARYESEMDTLQKRADYIISRLKRQPVDSSIWQEIETILSKYGQI